MAEIKDELFTSTNPYSNLDFVSARSPEELRDLLRSFNKPIKIHFITSHSMKLIAWISGDFKIKRTKK